MVRASTRPASLAITELSDKMKKGALSDLRGGEFAIVLGTDLARAWGDGWRQGYANRPARESGLRHDAGLNNFAWRASRDRHGPYDNNLTLIHISDPKTVSAR